MPRLRPLGMYWRREPKRPTGQSREAYRGARFASLGIELGVSVILGMAGGWWIDTKFDCRPWGLLVGVVLGFSAGIRSIMQTLRIFSLEDDTQKEREDNGEASD